MSDDLPTPEQVAAYLEARGWTVHPASGTDPRGMLVWQKGDHVLRLVPSRLNGASHHPGSIRWVLVALGQLELRPTPAEQVRRDMVAPADLLQANGGTCRQRHPRGSEAGTCRCVGPTDCPWRRSRASGGTAFSSAADRMQKGVRDE